MNKIDIFFELIRAVYGASRFNAQWPDDMHMQAAKTLWSDLIDKHTEEELKDALTHAQKMSVSGEEDWQWPNIGLILSGAKKPRGNSEEVQKLLAYTESDEDKKRRIETGRSRLDELKGMFK